MISAGTHWWMINRYGYDLFLVHNDHRNGDNRCWCLHFDEKLVTGWADIRTVGDDY